ncbi:prepilin-type N-terminal cleavage/methylation domain-containing protein [Providencia vermicola]|uniref:Prepilin-type N-terminal cleavage/methylation domain-containing protein n=2 Tax=Providencia TaxID=586 RepID=A0AAI9MV50_PROST|nr:MULTISPECIES: prepilin-type N-terminal cleavage/methylation domain-containing protein [Providencia]ELR5043304.1 prepilin-type N-terminal cleavage/methylation domain-containing protein [Providencia rettgeri]ELR5034539.1 prepilin-type N-terminal cleavage/methylation domain-containing protein [Providencia stuartii]ELR5120992.1 prepilin-type N-terminal cleavage/methylation domain-containing protein [Providencia stuartii]ELR5291284.1 prepilin-type N-terminal cleavage/methylation domain-containing
MDIEIEKHNKGFTLIEMLVVMFICSVALLPALYSWQQQQKKLQLVDAARQVSVFIYRHFMEGIYLNQHRVLFIDTTQGDWKLTFKEATNQRQIAVLASTPYAGVEIQSVSRLSVDFYGKQGTSRAFSLKLKNNFGQITIVLSALGRLRHCSNNKIVGIPRC